MVSLYGVRQNGGHSDMCSVDLQNIKMLTMCTLCSSLVLLLCRCFVQFVMQ